MRTRSNSIAKRPTRNDVAKRANVSGWTVSHVLNGDHSVSISNETRERVLEAARSLGYQPNTNARALATGKTSIVGFWTSFDYSQYRAHALHRLQTVMRGSGFELVIRDIEDELIRGEDLLKDYKIPVDGIIAYDTPNPGRKFVGDDPRTAIPFVSMGAFWAGDGDYVAVDLYPGAVQAVQHLIDTGRRNIYYMLPYGDGGSLNEARQLGYRQVMVEAGLEPRLIITGDIHLSAAFRTVKEFVATNRNVDAIFCLNDDMAMGAHRALYDCGIKIGHDIALVGCDGIEETEYLSPPLTTIVQPIEQMCRVAWEFLLKRMNDPAIGPQHCVLKPTLVVRASSQP